MILVSYNLNGIRSAINKGWIEWVKAANPDFLCVQETKAHIADIPAHQLEDLGYNCYWFQAEKKGYSGTGIISKTEPKNVSFGCGNEKYDAEGRFIRADFDGYSIASLYLPSGSSGEERQAFKFESMEFFYDYFMNLKQEFPNLIIAGDYNICHRPIDIHNPKSNAKSSGFLPEEREWMEKLLTSGYYDSFRKFNQDPHQYTWWSYRFQSREKNLGWRIDYNLCTEGMLPRLVRAAILPEAKHSDHCPILLEFN